MAAVVGIGAGIWSFLRAYAGMLELQEHNEMDNYAFALAAAYERERKEKIEAARAESGSATPSVDRI